jgi:glycerophosphoryl diester phosphodiesterase
MGKMPETRRSPSRPLIIAHRGASAHHPENTIPAFRAARRAGADMVELDVRLTADGVLAVHHDAELADGRPGAGTAWAALPPTVPDLPAAFAACAGMAVNVEIKSEGDPTDGGAAADAVVELVTERRLGDSVLVSSFDWTVIERVRAAAATVPTAFLVVALAEGDVERVAAGGHRALHPWYGAVTEELIRRCHAAGLAVNCWTCDEPQRMVEMAAWDIDGICTNDPALARRTLRG